MSKRPVQGELPLAPRTWGGKRKNAGRKPGKRPKVAHRSRQAFGKSRPVHVTMRLLPEAAGLRRRGLYRMIRRSMRASGHRDSFRICHYSIQGNHLHLLCEPRDREALARGVQGFASSVARRLNRARGRRGTVFADRYHVRVLEGPTEVRNALRYVLNNWRRHREHLERPAWKVDPFSSADLFDGWSGWYGARHAAGVVRPRWLDDDEPSPVAKAEFWLLRDGWRRFGAISPRDVPGPRPR